ncbi:hypothetical protein F5144DRAFT_617532 [Chaetomium tenue]|uniref:Uncharacterized protein n=1 Tax=Chaetomium tenue TaxID=1854479 RepID=A0ACB7PSB1_9PEZI|nr:hypothetical protein F5144DRAFT_617532 [Chaetomium globosum]
MAPTTDPKPQEGETPSNNGNPEQAPAHEPPALSPSSSSVGDNLAQTLQGMPLLSPPHVLPRSPRFGFSISRTAPATTGAELGDLPRNGNPISTLPSPHHWVTLFTASQEARDTIRPRPDHLQQRPSLVASWTRVGGYPYSSHTHSQLTTTPPIPKQNRGEQTASTLEANLTNLEGKLDEILASFGVSAADLDALDEQEAVERKSQGGGEKGGDGDGDGKGSSGEEGKKGV